MFFRARCSGPVTGRKLYRLLLCCYFVFAGAMSVKAQKSDTANKVNIDIHSEVIYHVKTDSGEVNRFIGDAVFHQGTDTLYCDSLYQNLTTNIIEAFSNVKIVQQGGTQATSDYLRYTSDKKLAFMQGNVGLSDGKNKLWGQELTYDLGTKVGVYNKGGTLQSDSTTVSSDAGVYNVKSKDARFTGNVLITDPQYKIKSKDLGYNTETKVETFYSHSVVTSDSGKSVLETNSGTYDSKNVVAHFTGHSSIWNDGEYIEADTMNYNKITGYGFAQGHVVSIDTTQHSTLYCGRAEYFRRKRVLWATIKPVLEQVNGKDTLYMRADTFYSAPMIKKKVVAPVRTTAKTIKDTSVTKGGDSLVATIKTVLDTAAFAKDKRDSLQRAGVKTEELQPTPIPLPAPSAPVDSGHKSKPVVAKGKATPQNKKEKTKTNTAVVAKPVSKYIIPEGDFVWTVPTTKYRGAGNTIDTTNRSAKKLANAEVADTSMADTTAPMCFIGYHHVLIFSDSLQGKCDSVCYTRADSTIKMIYAPIAWAHNSQITGDTISMYLDSNEIRRMFVPNNALVVSQSGPPKALLFNQVQGRTLTAYFKNNEIVRMVVFPNAESIYYPQDNSGAYIGVNQSKSERMRVYFKGQQLNKIKFEQEVHQTMTPLDKADIPNTKLSRFKWLMDQRPKSKEELFQ